MPVFGHVYFSQGPAAEDSGPHTGSEPDQIIIVVDSLCAERCRVGGRREAALPGSDTVADIDPRLVYPTRVSIT